jgi:GTPase SAR1 family protein
LGAGESGKSTLFKQMNHIFGKGFTDEDRRAYITSVRNNIMLCLRSLADNASTYGQLLPETEPIAAMLRSIDEIDSSTVEPQYVEQYKQFWADPTVKLAWDHRSEFQIYGCAEYFLDKLDLVSSQGYLPTQQDILQTRVRTTGIVESQFAVDNNKFSLYDVGGQRNERKKWIHCFENVTAVIFVAAISEYDQRLFEDEATNRVDEALKLFDEICNSRWFKDTSLLLFLNKRDLFEDKIGRIPLKTFFPNYNGPAEDAGAAQEWLASTFKAKNRNPDKLVYCFVTCATDSNNVENVFKAVKDTIIRNALRNIGMN